MPNKPTKTTRARGAQKRITVPNLEKRQDKIDALSATQRNDIAMLKQQQKQLGTSHKAASPLSRGGAGKAHKRGGDGGSAGQKARMGHATQTQGRRRADRGGVATRG